MLERTSLHKVAAGRCLSVIPPVLVRMLNSIPLRSRDCTTYDGTQQERSEDPATRRTADPRDPSIAVRWGDVWHLRLGAHLMKRPHAVGRKWVGSNLGFNFVYKRSDGE